MLSDNITVKGNILHFAGHNTLELASKYQTPLYLMDEQRIRQNCRMYLNAMRESFGPDALPLYASKAASFKRMYEIANEEGLGVDVVSAGEIHTAVLAGFPMDKVYFHGNSKTDPEITYAIENSVGCFVVEDREELDAIDRIAGAHGAQQRIIIRVTPGIDPHTYEAISTGKVDSKFGVAVETGQAYELIAYAMTLPNIILDGLHCHVGSQVFHEDVFERTSVILLAYIRHLRDDFGFTPRLLNLGGGYGVRYLESDPEIDIPARLHDLAILMKAEAEKVGVPLPAILMEPGRSVVADAGMTLYSVANVKRITGYKNYVCIDGGMTDNPRYALYRAPYTVLAAAHMSEDNALHADVVGRCCESDDVIQPEVDLPDVRRGDIIAVCTTGAYNYSMASNYNRVNRPPVVMLTEDGSYIAVRRETLEQLTINDV